MCTLNKHTCVDMYMYAYLYACITVFICMYVCMYVCMYMYVCMHVCRYARMYVCTYVCAGHVLRIDVLVPNSEILSFCPAALEMVSQFVDGILVAGQHVGFKRFCFGTIHWITNPHSTTKSLCSYLKALVFA